MSTISNSSSHKSCKYTPGMFWFAGWLFTLTFAKLIWWKALLALMIWPYYLGAILRVVPAA